MDYVKLVEDKLNLEEISDLVASPKCGAISIFVGTTRDNFEGKTVVKLEYEIYEAMAIKCMNEICADLRKKWNTLENIAIYHRYGTVPIKDASIIIAISSPHRAEAMEATRLCIENVKKSVTIWKKEVYKDCLPEWKENKECAMPYPPRIRLFKLEEKPEVQASFVPPHLIQVKLDSNEIENRIQKFIERKRQELDESNVRDFCPREDPNMEDVSCARVDAKFFKRKDSKGHLHVNRAFNQYYRDQQNMNYMKKYQPKNGIEERVQNAEVQIGFSFSTDKDIFKRIKSIEDRLLHMESISPEYIQFFGRNIFRQQATKKRIFSVCEIESMIAQLENKKSKVSVSSDEDKL